MKSTKGVITYIGDKNFDAITCIKTLKKKATVFHITKIFFRQKIPTSLFSIQKLLRFF